MLTATRAFLDDPNSVRAVFDDAAERLKREQNGAKTREQAFVLDKTLDLIAATRPMLDQAKAVRQILDGAIDEVRKGPNAAPLERVAVR
jgi:hypothetical protein